MPAFGSYAAPAPFASSGFAAGYWTAFGSFAGGACFWFMAAGACFSGYFGSALAAGLPFVGALAASPGLVAVGYFASGCF